MQRSVLTNGEAKKKVFPKIMVITPTWMVYFMKKPYEQMDDLGGKTHFCRKRPKKKETNLFVEDP